MASGDHSSSSHGSAESGAGGRRPFGHARCDGFTLLEMLISMALSVLLLTLLSVGVNHVVTDWERLKGRLDSDLDMALVALRIERALQGGVPYRMPKTDKGESIFFDGGRDRIGWISTVTSGRWQRQTGWIIRPAAQGRGVEVAMVSALAGDPAHWLESAPVVVFLPGYSLVCRYLYIDEEGNGKWFDEWSGSEWHRLPAAVNLRLFKEQSEAAHPVEIVAQIEAYRHPDVVPKPPQGIGVVR